MTIEMGNLVYGGHNLHGLYRPNPIEGGLDYGVHRAVATHGQGLQGFGGLEYGADASPMDTVMTKLSGAWDYAKANWAMILGGVVVAAVVAKYALKMDVPLLSNPRRKKRKQTAKQRAASLRNLKKGRSKAGKRRGAKASAARKPKKGGSRKRRLSPYQKRMSALLKQGIPFARAAKIASGKAKAPAARRGSRSRSRR